MTHFTGTWQIIRDRFVKRSSQIYSLQQFPMSNYFGNLGQACTKTPSDNTAFGEIPSWTEQVVFPLHCCEQVMSGLVVEEHTCPSDQMSHHAPAVPSSVISHTSPGWSYRHHFTYHLCPDVTRLYFAYFPPHSFLFCRHKTTSTIFWSQTKIQHQKFSFASKLFLMWFLLSRLQFSSLNFFLQSEYFNAYRYLLKG